jgi:excinuclease ABC subunit B
MAERHMFELATDFKASGDQPQAIEQLVRHFSDPAKRYATLLGVTGSGKTFTMAHLIQTLQRPTLVVSHNKTLAAQLYGEFRDFFPRNAVGYFVSYYDYYQPEAYIPQRDIYIEKDSSINEDIDRLRLHATSQLLTRRDVIIVASVSCIYGLGSPEDYQAMYVQLRRGQRVERRALMQRLVEIQYERQDDYFGRGAFRVRGDVLEVYPTYEDAVYRIEMFGDEVEGLAVVHPLTGELVERKEELILFPARHFVMPAERITDGVQRVEVELNERLVELKSAGKLLEAQRLEARTRYDIEMLREVGYCPGIENYSQPLSGRPRGTRPFTLIDYFPKDFLMIVDESHASIPQIRGMYHNDLTRKTTLIEHGFRLRSALDNRPMKFEEWEQSVNQALFVSATPGPYELDRCRGEVVEQIIRPTGLLDPVIRIRPARNQVADLVEEIKKRVAMGDRVLVTTLTKRMAEELSSYLEEAQVKVTYLHSEVETLERVDLLKSLRLGKFDVIVGVNLLREGLDLPEVSLVGILDADKEGFLRSATSLIQTIGRTARNVNAEVILYADKMTDSMRHAIAETERRRTIQQAYNVEHGITPETVRKAVRDGVEMEIRSAQTARLAVGEEEGEYLTQEAVNRLEGEMHAAAARLDFELAADIRDRILQLQQKMGLKPISDWTPRQPKKARRGKKWKGRSG